MTKDEILRCMAAGEIDVVTASKLFTAIEPTPEEVELFKRVERYRAICEERERERWKLVRELLERVASGGMTVDQALYAIQRPSFLKMLLLASSKFLLFKTSVYGLDQWREYCTGHARDDDHLAVALRPSPRMECGVRHTMDPPESPRREKIGKNAYLHIAGSDDCLSGDHSLSIEMGAECSMRFSGIFGAREYEFYCRSEVKFKPLPPHPRDPVLDDGWWEKDRD
jgi:hypothetical protein